MAYDPTFINDAEIAGLLMNVYEGVREKLVPISTPVLANIQKARAGGPRNFQWGGNGVRFNARVGRPVGMVASSSGYFPNHATALETQGLLDIKRMYVTREVDGLAVLGTQSKKAAYQSLVKKVIEEAKDAIELGMAEIVQGNGTGIKGLITAVGSTTSITVSSPYGVAGAGEGGLHLDVGMQIAVLDTSGADAVLGRATITVAANSGDSVVLTLGTAIPGMASTDKVVACTDSDTSYNAYPNGLINITNRGNAYTSLHGIDAATAGYSRWNSVRLTSADVIDVEVVSESDIFDLIHKIKGRSGKDAKSKPGEFLLVGTVGLEKKLVEQFYPSRNLTPQDFIEIKGGYKAVSIFGLPFISDPMVPAGTIYLIHLPSLVWVDSKDWGEVRFQSAPAWRFIPGQDAFQYTFGAYLNLGTTNRAAHGSIVGYTDANRYSLVI